MKKSLIITSFVAAILILFLVSCKSQPPAATEEPTQPSAQQAEPEGGPSQASLDALNAAAAQAEEARKKAGDFDGDTYFPGEWESAEAQHAEAKNMPRKTDEDCQKAVTAYEAASAAYNSIFDLAVPLYAQAREDEIMAFRTSLIEGGARQSFPEYFPPADEAALLALDQYEKKDYYAARESAAKSFQMYHVLATAFDAWHMRQEINERDFSLHDIDNYYRGGEILSDAMDAYRAEDLPVAQENADAAQFRYNLVLIAGWTYYADLRSSLAEGERLAALDSKTNIASKYYFNDAEANYGAAQELMKSEKYEEASKLFIQAEAMYVIASMEAMEKRSLANAAIHEALENIERSDENARLAEQIIEGGSK